MLLRIIAGVVVMMLLRCSGPGPTVHLDVSDWEADLSVGTELPEVVSTEEVADEVVGEVLDEVVDEVVPDAPDSCIPDCDGRDCGYDPTGCGVLCGTCAPHRACSSEGTCVCLPDHVCGTDCCTSEQVCRGGACCDKDCHGKDCGEDGCGGWCGHCTPTQLCGAQGRCILAECNVAECPIFPEPGWTVSCNAFNHCEYARIDGLAEDVEIFVPPGTFVMGNPEAEPECNEGDDDPCLLSFPPMMITFTRGYFIDKFEVSIRQYARCVEEGFCIAPSRCFGGVSKPWSLEEGYDPGRALWPVGCVTLGDATKYCEWAGKQVPTEAQWERAAKGSSHRTYPWGDQPSTCDLAHTRECIDWMVWNPNVWLAEVDSHPLGLSPVGAVNMAGNVLEWVQDCFHSPTQGGAPADGSVWEDDCHISPEGGYLLDTKKGGSIRFAKKFAKTFIRLGTESCADCIGAGGDEGIRCARLLPPDDLLDEREHTPQ